MWFGILVVPVSRSVYSRRKLAMRPRRLSVLVAIATALYRCLLIVPHVAWRLAYLSCNSMDLAALLDEIPSNSAPATGSAH